MTQAEFATVIGYISLAIGKPLAPDAQKVYYDLLGDLPFDVLQIAAKRAVLEHPWATFPSVAELRQAAVLTQRGEIKALSAGEAWEMAWDAIGNIDPEIPTSLTKAMGKLPPTVAAAVKAMGVPALCYGKEPVTVVRGQFMKVFSEISEREARTALLPQATKQAIAAARPPSVAGLLAGIGAKVEE